MDLVALRAAASIYGRRDDHQEELRLHEAEHAEDAMMLNLIMRLDTLQLMTNFVIRFLKY